MTVRKHKQNFEKVYKRISYSTEDIKFPLVDIDKLDWNKGKLRNDYNRYFYRRFTCHILSNLRISDGQRILVIGCGFGFDERNIRMIYPNVSILSVDISEEMIKRAINDRSPSQFLLSIAEELPFKDNSFDRILSREVIEHVIDPQIMLFEISRVLKPQGIAVVTTENEESLSPENFYCIYVRSKLAKTLRFPVYLKNYTDKAPKLSEMDVYVKDAGLEMVKYFWDGALYRSLLLLMKPLKKFIKFRISKWAQWFSCLENNRTLAYWFCDQVKYVLRKPKDNKSIVYYKYKDFYLCVKCHRSLRKVYDNNYECNNCGQKYLTTNRFPILMESGDGNQREHNVGTEKAKKRNLIIFEVLDFFLSTIYKVFYVSIALICTLFSKKNDVQLSHLMAPDDQFQKYLKTS